MWSLFAAFCRGGGGFGLGIFCGAEPPVGCRESDLTPVPDESFVSPASASSVETPRSQADAREVGLSDLRRRPQQDDAGRSVRAEPCRSKGDLLCSPPATTINIFLISGAAAAGHQIALHSASHEYSDIYQSADAYWKDIDLLKERLSLRPGRRPAVSALPGGDTSTVSRRYGGRGLMQQLKEEVTAKGYAYVDWNVCAEDAVGGKPSAGTIFRNIVRETGEQTQCIVLMHDSATTRTTAEALPDIIQWYKDNGFTFLTVEQAVPLPTT